MNKELTPICHHNMTYLAYHCVTMNELMDIFYEKTELSDVICENCPKLGGETSKANFEKNVSQY